MIIKLALHSFSIAQNLLHTFSLNFPIDGEVANLLAIGRCNGIWEMTQHSRQRTFAYANLLQTCYLCYGFVVDLLRGSCQLVTDLLRDNGFWPYLPM